MKRLRAFLLILLMLTTPLQAMAGKVLLCESFHPALSSAVDGSESGMHAHPMSSHSQQQDGQTHHGFHDAAPDLNHAGVSHADHHAAMGDDHDDSESHAGSCNMCASCPVGSVAVTMPEYRVPPSELASGGVFHFAFHIPEFAPDLPDDPPRA